MKLSELIKTTEIKIKDTDLIVKIKNELSWFEQLELIALDKKILDEMTKDQKEKTENDNRIERGKYLTWKLITDWNLTDDVEKPLPITKENIEKLPTAVLIPVTNEIIKLASKSELKKKE